MLFYLTHSLFSIPSGILSDRIGRKAVLGMGYAMFIALAVGLYFARDIYSLLLCFLAYGVFFAMIDGVQRAFVVDLSPAHLKATALGTFHAATGLVALPAAFIIGLIWERFSPEAAFLYGAFFALAALVALLFVKDRERIMNRQ
jgi:MFS family permease